MYGGSVYDGSMVHVTCDLSITVYVMCTSRLPMYVHYVHNVCDSALGF